MPTDLDGLLTRVGRGERSAFASALEKVTTLWEQRASELDDALDDIARAASQGSDGATELLLTAVHQLRLARPAILRVVVDPTQVDEVAQQVLIAVERGIHSFEARSRFRTWLHTVARNESLMLLRRLQRTDGRQEPLDLETPPAANQGRISSIVATRTTINQAIEDLPEPYRETIRLRVIGQLEYEEIANKLGVPIGTVRSRINKARQLLTESLTRS
jgi:RNA polymerase sigma-70 factor (ECF subfamily)